MKREFRSCLMIRAAALLLAVLLLPACGNKGDLVPPPPEPASGP